MHVVAPLSLTLLSRECFGHVTAYLSRAIIKMARSIQPSHSKSGRGEEEDREKLSAFTLGVGTLSGKTLAIITVDLKIFLDCIHSPFLVLLPLKKM